jgi:uncharacterized lipoprotein YajG
MKQIFNLKGVKMKKGLFLLASVAMLMLAGCGESGGVTSASNNEVGSSPSNDGVVITNPVGAEEVAVTTPHNLYNISNKLGTPPALPAE